MRDAMDVDHIDDRAQESQPEGQDVSAEGEPNGSMEEGGSAVTIELLPGEGICDVCDKSFEATPILNTSGVR